MPRLYRRADKIFTTGANVRAMWSRRRGHVRRWMREENRITSSGRVSIELVGAITQRSKFIRAPFTQKLRESPVTKQYVLVTLMTNCKTCMAGGNITTSIFCLEPPTLQSYLSQWFVSFFGGVTPFVVNFYSSRRRHSCYRSMDHVAPVDYSKKLVTRSS